MTTLAAVHVGAGGASSVLLGPDGELLGSGQGDGVDQAVSSLPSRPDRVVAAMESPVPSAVAVGIVEFISTESAARALALAGYQVIDLVSFNDGRSRDGQASAIVEAEAELILLAGGTTGGETRHLEELAELVAFARDRLVGEVGYAPELLFAGNPEGRDTVGEVFEDRGWRTAENVRPACGKENLEPVVARLATLAKFAPVPGAEILFPAGAARAAVVRQLGAPPEEGALLLAEGENGAEAVSILGSGWNRVLARRGGLEAAVGRHRESARELGGVPLLRNVAEAFADYVPGRDLLDVAPPAIVAGGGGGLDELSSEDLVYSLVELSRPRGVTHLVSARLPLVSALGAALLAGHPVDFVAFQAALDPLCIVISLDGPADAVEAEIEGESRTIDEGNLVRIPMDAGTRILLRPLGGGDLGEGRGRRLELVLPELPEGLLLDTRGTPVPPSRRVRILSER